MTHRRSNLQKIAIIGSGISGLSQAYMLKDDYEITLYEKNKYYGGHARTLEVIEASKKIAIDTGFIVFNYQTYPYLVRFFKHLNIPTKKSDMSFGVSIDNGKFEYGTRTLSGLFADKRHLFHLKFLRMLTDILKFNSHSKKQLISGAIDSKLTLEDYIEKLKVSDWFRNYYLLAMGAAIWSTPVKSMSDFPALTFMRFFNNHGLLRAFNHIPWYTVAGGSSVYVNKVIDQLKIANVKFNRGVNQVIRNANHIVIRDDQGELRYYDKVIFACHSDEVLKLLDSPTQEEVSYLGSIKYHANEAVLHSDSSYMPKRKKAWSSWVYLKHQLHNESVMSLSYWMNNLQKLDAEKNYFVTINPQQRLDPNLVIDRHTFEHPIFNQAAIESQEGIDKIQGINHTFYIGAYLRYGFHEDGILSAVKVTERLGVKIPWAD
ncbi:NAD(P)-binding protein [Thiotrichales bacterium 19S3-7]|nr:NAD(P)-binding protein [Thiotrichales bacterium 19S3-7]MCF6800642.1 NAD(P)-binding protein [Thiotrichales bacterium 19S3-11]